MSINKVKGKTTKFVKWYYACKFCIFYCPYTYEKNKNCKELCDFIDVNKKNIIGEITK